METEVSRAPDQTPAGKKGKKGAYWLIGCGVVAVVLIVVLVICGILTAIMIPSFTSVSNKAERKQAETVLRNVMMAGEIYRVDNDGTYDGMKAADLTEDYTSVKITDGTPSKDMVALSSVTSSSYKLAYVGKSGTEYGATVKDGSIEFDFDTGLQELPFP